MNKKSRPIEILERVRPILNQERWMEAIDLLKDDFAVVQDNWELTWNLAWCYFKLARLDEARKYMIRASKLAPNASCKVGLGAIYLQRKQFKKAETNCAESLQLRESYIARITLALAYMEQRKLTEAEKVHLEGIQLRPKSSRRYEAYADFLFDLEREDEAQEMYDRAKKLRQQN
jgi:tetratricopeptide (TPR) repeat protein